MKKNIAYGCLSVSVPGIPGNPAENSLRKHTIILQCALNISEETVLSIKFSNSSHIVKFFPDANVACQHRENWATVNVVSFIKDKQLRLHFIVSNGQDLCDPILSSVQDVNLQNNPALLPAEHIDVAPLPVTYPFLVASALQEELDPLLALHKHAKYLPDEPMAKTLALFNSNGKVFNIIAYSINKMGMPFNAVALTRIIEKFKPTYVIFIGTCGGLRKNNGFKEGDVLIPEYIYAYDHGKYDDTGKFQIEHRHYDVSDLLRTLTADMIQENKKQYRFNFDLQCGFCSGSSVVSFSQMRDRIKKVANRKVMGFDMEAYVLAIIKQLYADVHTLVIKGVMDFGARKKDTHKKAAKQNAATLANDLLKFIVDKNSFPPAKGA